MYNCTVRNYSIKSNNIIIGYLHTTNTYILQNILFAHPFYDIVTEKSHINIGLPSSFLLFCRKFYFSKIMALYIQKH